jgi:hypothetical protein
MQYDVKHTLDALMRDLELTPRETIQAAVGATNGAIRTTIAFAARLVAPHYPGLKIGAIKRQIRAEWASARQREDVRGALMFSVKRFRIFSNFRATQTARGVRLGRGAPWRIETLDGAPVDAAALANAFIQRSRRSGLAQVLKRTAGKQRYPLTAFLAASLSSAVSEDGKDLMPLILRVARGRYITVFGQRARFLAAKREGRL